MTKKTFTKYPSSYVAADTQDPYWDSYIALNDDEFKAIVDSYKKQGQGSRYTDWSLIVAELKGQYGIKQAKELADAICYGDTAVNSLSRKEAAKSKSNKELLDQYILLVATGSDDEQAKEILYDEILSRMR